MNVLNNRPIGTKISIVFVCLVMIVALSGVISYRMSGVLEAASSRQAEATKLVLAAKDALAAVIDLSSHLRGLVMTRDPGNATDMKKDQERFDARIAEARRLVDVNPDVVTMIDAVQAAQAAWRAQLVDVVVPLTASTGTLDQATAMMSTPLNRKLVGEIRRAAAVVQSSAQASADAASIRTSDALAVVRQTSILTTVIAALAAAGMSWLLSSLIAKPVVAMTRVMGRLAAGDLDVTVVARGRRDEIGSMASAVQSFKDAAIEKIRIETGAVETKRLADEDRNQSAASLAESARQQRQVVEAIGIGLARLSGGELVYRIEHCFALDYEKLRADFNDAMTKLQDTMSVVTANASAIRSGTSEISVASNDLSRRTEQQAASLEETAAALDEITATVRKTAEGSNHAREVVGQANQAAEHSGRVVGQAVEAMKGIEKSAGQIGNIIGVIDEIAFQTNLLALNAGVEAARAGDAGRGFAVVASEVRALAQRSADAAKEIKALIRASSQQVEQGVKLVAQTGGALDTIMVQVAQINTIVIEIAASAQEQAVALDEVNTAINQMDQVTQQNAAMVEQSTAASQCLAQETEQLVQLIGRFQIGQGATAERLGARPTLAKAAPKLVQAKKIMSVGGRR